MKLKFLIKAYKIQVLSILRIIINALSRYNAKKISNSKISGKYNNKNIKNILIINLHGIGDLIMTTPVFEILKKSFPALKITLAVRKQVSPLFDLDERIDECIIINDTFSIKDILKIRKKKFDAAVILNGGLFASVISIFMKTKYIYGMILNNLHLSVNTGIGLKYEEILFNKKMHLADIPLKVISPLINENNPDSGINRIYSLRAGNLKLPDPVNKINDPYIVITPETNWEIKNIPVELIESIIEKMINKKYDCILLGTDTSYNVKNTNRKFTDLRGKTSLLDACAVINKAGLVITADSAFMHIAAALNIPNISLFGPTDPEILVPRTEKSFFIKKNLYCSPCYKFIEKPICRNKIFKNCMKYEINDIVSKIYEILIKFKITSS